MAGTTESIFLKKKKFPKLFFPLQCPSVEKGKFPVFQAFLESWRGKGFPADRSINRVSGKPVEGSFHGKPTCFFNGS